MSRRRRVVTILGLVGLGALLATRVWLAEPFSIPSASMAPTLAAGDHVLVDKTAFRRGSAPARGELVVFRAPRSREVALKRVVALAGQTVELRDGALYVDGRRRVEAYSDPRAIDSVYFGPVTVPRRAVFVLGDNRGDSTDSRSFGPVPVTDLIGRARARIWPPSRWHVLR
jgi:signal peptidase I